MTTEKILKEHGLDFEIKKLPLMATDDDGTQILTPYFGLMNSQSREVINVCKAGYTISQNAEVIAMVLEGMKKFGDGLSVQAAGSINGGRRVYVQLKIDGVKKILNTKYVQYVTVIDSNDGSTGLSVGVGDMFMHCRNQFFKFYKEGNSRFRHTATIEQKIKEIPNLIETALGVNLKQIRTYENFASTKLTRNLADKMVKHVLGYDRKFTSLEEFNKLSGRSVNMMDELYRCIDEEKAVLGDNVLALFNGATRYTTWVQKPTKRENGDMESLLIGAGYKKAASAFEFCMAQ